MSGILARAIVLALAIQLAVTAFPVTATAQTVEESRDTVFVLSEEISLSDAERLLRMAGVEIVSFEQASPIRGAFITGASLGQAVATYRRLFEAAHSGQEPYVFSFRLEGSIPRERLEAVGAPVLTHLELPSDWSASVTPPWLDPNPIQPVAVSHDGDSGSSQQGASSLLASSEASKPAAWMPDYGTLEGQAIADPDRPREIHHILAWNNQADLDSFEDDVYEHDVQLYTDENTGVHPLCFSGDENFWMNRESVLVEATFPAEAEPYFDTANFEDSCNEMDLTVGLFSPDELQAAVEYEIWIRAEAGEEPESVFSLAPTKAASCPGPFDDPACTGFSLEAQAIITPSSGCTLPGIYEWTAGGIFDCRDVQRVSIAPSGEGGDGNSYGSSVSADGALAVFDSAAGNLITSDGNGVSDVFVHNKASGSNERASLSEGGGPPNDHSYQGVLSADGRFIAFESAASDLVQSDDNDLRDVFVRDLITGTNELISVSSTGDQGNGWSRSPAISQDGRLVAFVSTSTNLVSPDGNVAADVFLRDRLTGQTQLVSAALLGGSGNGWSEEPAVSGDGRYVAFRSDASNLVSADGNGSLSDVFVRDMVIGQTELVSVGFDGSPANGFSEGPSISADGQYIAFGSYASNIASDDVGSYSDVFRCDTVLNACTLISEGDAGEASDGDSYGAKISLDAAAIAFSSDASNLVAQPDLNALPDAYVRRSGSISRVSVSYSGVEPDGGSYASAISADGSTVVFDSYASNIVPGDIEGWRDVFVS